MVGPPVRILPRARDSNRLKSEIVSLVMRADLAAMRARLYIQEDWDQESASLSSGEGGTEERWQTYKMPEVQKELAKCMIFC